MDGVIVVNKPEGWTSHDVVNKMRRIAATRRVGHLGTLDPMATGVLPLLLNRATRLAQFYTRCDKKYEALIRFGHSTDSYDRDGLPLSEHVEVSLDRAQIENALEEFRGPQLQRPPGISAKKIAGTPAYKLARNKVAFHLDPVEINIYSLDLLDFQPNEIRLAVHCSAGTYVRALAHDLGRKFGCGAWLHQLCRTMSGDFTIADARALPELESLAAAGRLNEALIPASQLLPQFPSENVDALTAAQIRHGRDFRVSPFRVQRGAKYVKAISPQGDLIAIGEGKLPNLYHPMLVL